MSKEAFIKLNKYAEDLKNKLTSPLPSKHTHRPASYKQFLERELKSITTKIDAMKLAGVDAKK